MSSTRPNRAAIAHAPGAKAWLAGLTVAALATAATPAIAGEASSTIRVSVVVADSCTVATGAMDFNRYDPSSPNDLLGQASLDVRCTTDRGITVGLDEGASGDTAVRAMENGADAVRYNLYRDSRHSLIWGKTPGVDTLNTYVSGPTTLTVYGHMTAGQSVPSGSYSDTINVTLSY